MGKFWRSFRFCLTVWFKQFHFDSRREYVDHSVKHSSTYLYTVGGNGNIQLMWADDNWLAIKWMDSLLVRISVHWLTFVKWETPGNSRHRKVQMSTENNCKTNGNHTNMPEGRPGTVLVYLSYVDYERFSRYSREWCSFSWRVVQWWRTARGNLTRSHLGECSSARFWAHVLIS